MGLFSSISNDDKSLESLNVVQQGSFFKTIEYQLSDIVEKIKNIDSLNEEEIKQIIIRQHSMILNYDLFLASNETREQAQTLFTNRVFLKCFLDVIRLIEISLHEKICINKLAYDYYINPNMEDNIVSDLLYRLTTEVNGTEVVVLSGILGLDNAQKLSMIRNSTFNVEKAVHRVNTFLLRCNCELNISAIASIYSYLFEKFTDVFLYTMLESGEHLDYVYKKRFDSISITILEMLNSLPTKDITKILYDYAFILNRVKIDTKVRFAIRTAERYGRIIKIIESIQIQDNLFIP